MKPEVSHDRPFKQVDVFTDRPGWGNPLVVILETEGLTGEEMQQVANWTNLSETVFLTGEDDSTYRLRIFTLGHELPFAGHPTIGAAHAAVEAGLINPLKPFTQICGLGRLKLRREGELFWVRVPRPTRVQTRLRPDDLAPALSGLNPIEPIAFDIGPIWTVARLGSLDDLRNLRLDRDRLIRLSRRFESVLGLVLYAFNDQGGIELRAFAPAGGVDEDPVCGSGNLAAAAHLEATGGLERLGRTYLARQGWNLGRDGRVHLKVLDEELELGGQAVTVFDGLARL